MSGEVGILNVGAGDTKLTFDKSNPADMIRAARIVKDMLRRGYALLVEVPNMEGGKSYRRATDFDENTCEYIIADLDPIEAQKADEKEEKANGTGIGREDRPQGTEAPRKVGRPRRIPASEARSVAVARTAGG